MGRQHQLILADLAHPQVQEYLLDPQVQVFQEGLEDQQDPSCQEDLLSLVRPFHPSLLAVLLDLLDQVGPFSQGGQMDLALQ